MGIKKIGLLFLTLLFPCVIFAQKPIAKRVVLDWKFFKNDRPFSSSVEAYTWYRLNYKFKTFPTSNSEKKINIQFEVNLVMDTAKSYFQFEKRPSGQRLLKHEQGHADIGVIIAEKLKKAFAETEFLKENYLETIRTIYAKLYAEMLAENKRYDQETNHCKDLRAQRMWDLYFDAQFAN